MRGKAFIIIWISLMLGLASLPVEGQADDACAPMTAHWSEAMGYTIGRPFVRYAPYNQQVVLMEGKRRKDVQVIATDLVADHFYGELSPDCRYLAATLALPNGMTQVVAWDLLTNTRANAIDSAPSVYRFHWSPSHHYAIAESHDGLYLWNIPADQWLFLSPASAGGDVEGYFTWDMARGQLLAVLGDTVRAYDLATGQVVAAYDSGSRAAPVSYVLSDDRTRIAVFTSEDERVNDRPSGLAVWDRDSGAKIVLNPQTLAAVWVSQVRFSPENRYLVIARDTIRIWDLQAVRPDGLPTYQYDGPDARVGTVRFASTDTLETMSVVSCAACSTYWLRWNLATGDFLHAYDEPRDRIVTDFELE